MPYVPDEFVEEVLSRTNIVDVVSGYVTLKKKGRDYFGLCPFHTEKTPSFSVSDTKQIFYCFGCHEGGNAISFLRKYENCTFYEAVSMLAERAGMKVPEGKVSPEKKREADRKANLMELHRQAANFYYMCLMGADGGVGREYFQRRGLDAETIKSFGLGFSLPYSDGLYKWLREKGYDDKIIKDSGLVIYPDDGPPRDRFRNRVMFPIQDASGHVIAFGGRVLGKGEPKYLNSPESSIFDKSYNLYALKMARRTKRNEMILCEGYMDVIALHRSGFDNAVASLGTALTRGHATILARYTDTVLLCYDSDKAGVKAALRAIPILKAAGLTVKILHMDPYKDPDELITATGPEEFEDRISKAQNSFFFTLDVQDREYNLEDPDELTKCMNRAAGRVAGITDELERNNYIPAVAKRYGADEKSFRKRVNEIGLSGHAIDEIEVEKAPPKPAGEKYDGIEKSQDLLITALTEHPGLYPQIKDYLSPEDFTGEVYQQIARVLFRKLGEGPVSPAVIMESVGDERIQNVVARMFNSSSIRELSPGDLEGALRQTLAKIKMSSPNTGGGEGMSAAQKAIADKKLLQKINTLSLNV
ncbi:MAG: DNA primase [Eubacterium sp.]|nr:DNA primase [Eubacterium sp.]